MTSLGMPTVFSSSFSLSSDDPLALDWGGKGVLDSVKTTIALDLAMEFMSWYSVMAVEGFGGVCVVEKCESLVGLYCFVL